MNKMARRGGRALATLAGALMLSLISSAGSAQGVDIIITDNIKVDATWTGVVGVTKSVTLNSNIVLTIEAGTIIKMWPGASFTIKGKLRLPGGSGVSPVVVTSLYDDEYGGDTDGEGNAILPQPGDWGGLVLDQTTQEISSNGVALTMANVLFRYGGSSTSGVLYCKGISPVYDYLIFEYNNYTVTAQGDKDNLGFALPSLPQLSNVTFSNNNYLIHCVHFAFAHYNGGMAFSGNKYNAILHEGTPYLNGLEAYSETWEIVNDMPFLIYNIYTIPSNLSMTMQAGSVFKSIDSSKQFLIYSTLTMESTPEDPVVFTSYYDDTHGGDTNADGSDTTPNPGDWGYVLIGRSTTDFHDALIRFGGKNFEGCILTNGQPTIRDSVFDQCSYALGSFGTDTKAGSPIINNNVFQDVNYPYTQKDIAFPTIGTNTYNNVRYRGIFVKGSMTTSGTVTGTWTPIGDSTGKLPYVLADDLTIGEGVTVTLAESTVVKMLTNTANLIVQGLLVSEGTDSGPLIFTSYKDDQYGGDTNADGATSSPDAGDWSYVRLQNGAIQLEKAIFRFGGNGQEGALNVYTSSPQVRNTTFYRNTYALGSDGSSTGQARPIISSCTFDSNTYPLQQKNFAFPTYVDNSFVGNAYPGIFVNGSMTTTGSDTGTWSGASNLAYVLNEDVTVGSGVTLVIPGGTVVKFMQSAYALNSTGVLDLQGTGDNRVVFTSYKDDEYGGDTNGENSSPPARGDWSYVSVQNSLTVFDYALVRFGGASKEGALYVLNASPTVDNVLFTTNTYALGTDGTASTPGNANVSNNTFTDNSYPLQQLDFSFPTYSGNSFVDNLYTGIFVQGSMTVSGTAVGTWTGATSAAGAQPGARAGEALAYVPNAAITIGSGVTLTIPAGTIVKPISTSATITVSGAIDWGGTADDPVIFTSYKDDAHAGDTNGDGLASLPGVGQWGSVCIQNDANVVQNAVFRYGGSSTGAICIKNSQPQVRDNSFVLNAYAVTVDSANSPLVTNNDFVGNTTYGLQNKRTQSITSAEDNYWGHETGPTHAENPLGEGDKASDGVDYTPFLGASIYTYPRATASEESHAFGSVMIGETSSWELTVTNAGSAPLNVYPASVGSTAYSVLAPTDLATLQPTESVAVQLQFAPINAGAFNTNLTIVTDSPSERQMVIPVTGTGVAPTPTATVTPTATATPTPTGDPVVPAQSSGGTSMLVLALGGALVLMLRGSRRVGRRYRGRP
ncbi:MAG: choice-of-anchor D domain-containing protein [Candidatus Schekmanbacteria bacterium]|nr:choice-of-anchor D domain-containing protein [Candidatus Schekmanbacteria bacterium]